MTVSKAPVTPEWLTIERGTTPLLVSVPPGVVTTTRPVVAPLDAPRRKDSAK
jgi:hypothetical protein